MAEALKASHDSTGQQIITSNFQLYLTSRFQAISTRLEETEGLQYASPIQLLASFLCAIVSVLIVIDL
jgi:hypothetical protein